MASDPHPSTIERQLGWEAGAAFERRLREHEAAEREELRSNPHWADGAPDEELGRCIEPPALGTLELQGEIERLRFFYDAVQESRAWRLTQRLRRLVGRAW